MAENVQRLAELEVRLAFQDNTLETLNSLVAEQQAQIQTLQADVDRLTRQVAQLLAQRRDPPVDESPPHY